VQKWNLMTAALAASAVFGATVSVAQESSTADRSRNPAPAKTRGGEVRAETLEAIRLGLVSSADGGPPTPTPEQLERIRLAGLRALNADPGARRQVTALAAPFCRRRARGRLKACLITAVLHGIPLGLWLHIARLVDQDQRGDVAGASGGAAGERPQRVRPGDRFAAPDQAHEQPEWVASSGPCAPPNDNGEDRSPPFARLPLSPALSTSL